MKRGMILWHFLVDKARANRVWLRGVAVGIAVPSVLFGLAALIVIDSPLRWAGVTLTLLLLLAALLWLIALIRDEVQHWRRSQTTRPPPRPRRAARKGTR